MRQLIVIILLILLSLSSCGIGPIFFGPKTAVWDTVTGATGYYLYWRTPGTSSWVDTQRIAVSNPPVDLTMVGIPVGTWEMVCTARDAVSESEPSNMIVWTYQIRLSPKNYMIQ